MAADIRQDFGTDTAITISLNNLADGSSIVATALDLGAVAPFALSLELKLTGLSGGTDLVEISST